MKPVYFIIDILKRHIYINEEKLNWVMKKVFKANLFSLKSIFGVILQMAFNFYRCCLSVVEMLIYSQKDS